MVELSLDKIARIVEGRILQGAPSLSFLSYNIDSRETKPGELFFAIVSRRNGHDYVPMAASKGALGAVVSQDISPIKKDFALLKVGDSLRALQALAARVLDESAVKVVGITGSIGKTTTKEFTAALLSKSFRVLKSEGNYNNYLGLPLSLLKIENGHQVAVLEMGTSAPGEIRDLTRIAPPDIAVITNINPVHLEFLKNLESIALAKKEILEGTKAGGVAVLNWDDRLIRKIGSDWRGERVTFGLSPEADIHAQDIQMKGFEGMTFHLTYGSKTYRIHFPFLYDSYLYNLLAALGVAHALHVPFESITEQISALKPLPMRGGLIHLTPNIRLVNDCYNSNPKALESALKGLSSLPAKRKVAVLGDMLELGEKEIEFHIRAGQQAAEWGWTVLVTVGPLSRHMVEGAIASGMAKNQISSFETSEEASEKVWHLLEEGDLVLVKGSRRVRTEKIVEKIKEKRREL